MPGAQTRWRVPGSTARAMTRRLLLVVIVCSALLRTWDLGSVPLGLHGDEAITGFDARRVLTEGWIGPYAYPSALGQPTGPVYLAALVLAALGQSTATLRLSMALFGVVTVLCTYLAGRAMFSRAVGLLAAALLAAQPWHLHLSRVAFMVNAWPCLEMAALWLLFRARRRGGVGRWALAGATAGLGIYTYNAYPLSLPLLAVPALVDLVAPPAGRTRRAVLGLAAVAGLVAVLVALPMAEYARTHEEYFWHAQDVAVSRTAAWRDADWSGRVALLGGRAVEWGRGVLVGGRPDDGDGLGGRGFPLLDPVTALAAAVGAGMALRRWRQPAPATLLAALAVLPLGALLTIEDGLYRRTFGLAPLLAILAALPLARLWRLARARGRAPQGAAAVALGALLVLNGARNAQTYFGPLQASEQMRYVFPYQVDAASRFVAGLPPGTAVFWYSERWPADYETRRWFAPAADVSERAPELGAAVEAGGTPVLRADSDRESVFILLGAYRDLAEAIRRRHRGAALVEQTRDGEILFRAVRVPPLAAPGSAGDSPAG